jgi:hypothetical protein
LSIRVKYCPSAWEERVSAEETSEISERRETVDGEVQLWSNRRRRSAHDISEESEDKSRGGASANEQRVSDWLALTPRGQETYMVSRAVDVVLEEVP